MKKQSLLFAWLLVSFAFSAIAGVAPVAEEPVWNPMWIADRVDLWPDSAVTTPAPFFRKSFSVAPAGVKSAKVRVCGLEFYELYFNGKRVGDQVLAPAVSNYDTRTLKNLLYDYDDQSTQRLYYNEFDVADLLTAGENVVGMILGNGWYNQRDYPGYGYLADPANCTLWETWSGDGNAEGCGHCHPMFGSVVAWMFRSLAGICPDESRPGMKEIVIKPEVWCGLDSCRASVMTPNGRVSTDWRRLPDGSIEMGVAVPRGSRAILVCPDGRKVRLKSGRHDMRFPGNL